MFVNRQGVLLKVRTAMKLPDKQKLASLIHKSTNSIITIMLLLLISLAAHFNPDALLQPIEVPAYALLLLLLIFFGKDSFFVDVLQKIKNFGVIEAKPTPEPESEEANNQNI